MLFDSNRVCYVCSLILNIQWLRFMSSFILNGNGFCPHSDFLITKWKCIWLWMHYRNKYPFTMPMHLFWGDKWRWIEFGIFIFFLFYYFAIDLAQCWEMVNQKAFTQIAVIGTLHSTENCLLLLLVDIFVYLNERAM